MKPFWLFSFAPCSKIARGGFTTPCLSLRRYYSSSTLNMSAASKVMVVDPFCFRQFSEHEASQTYGGTIFEQTVTEFEDIVNSRYISDSQLQDGYAPFCKHLFLKNDFTQAKVNVLPLTEENEVFVRTEYQARNDKELPILQRFIPLEKIGGEEKLPGMYGVLSMRRAKGPVHGVFERSRIKGILSL